MKYGRAIVATLIAGLLSGLPLLAAPGGMLSLHGRALVNGRSVVSGSAVLPGDAVVVQPNGLARLVLPGATVLAGANTRFSMLTGRKALRLNTGMLTVSGGVPVLVKTRSLVPASSSSVYMVKRAAGVVYVEAARGSLTLTGAGQPYTVAAGHAVRFDDQSNTTASAAGSGGGLSTAAVVAIGVAVFAAAWIATYELTKSSSNSPSY